MKFTERSALEAGFAQVFEADVAPQLHEFEFERKAILSKTYRKMGMYALAGVVVAGLAYALAGEEYLVATILLPGFLAAIVCFTTWAGANSRWTSKIKDVAMPAICDHVGELTYSNSGHGFSIGTMMDLKLLPKHDDAILSNLLRGTHNGTGFEMVHAKLTTDNEGSNKATNFEGLLFRVDVPERAPGRIVMMRDRGKIGNKLAEAMAFGSTRSLPKVTFDHPEFEAAFEVYAEQPEAAKAFLPDAILDSLLQIGDEQGQGRGAEAFVAGFSGSSFYMALKRDGTFMKMGGLTTPVVEIEADLHGVFDDIALSHQVIDRLHST